MLQKTANYLMQAADPRSEPRRAPKTTGLEREAEVQKVIADLEVEMRRLVDLLVEQTNH